LYVRTRDRVRRRGSF